MILASVLSDLRFDWGNLAVAAGIAVVVLPVLAWYHFRKKRRPRVRFSSLRNVKPAAPSLKVRLRHLPFVLRLVAVAVFLGAFAHPYLERERELEPKELGTEEKKNEDEEEERKKIEVPTEGISIQLVIDRSGSMGTHDKIDAFGRRRPGKTNFVRFEGELVSKLDLVKIISQRFINGTNEINEEKGDSVFAGRSSDMISLMTFARYPLLACPLTLRHELLLDYVSQAETVTLQEENGTYIGYALERAVLHAIDTKSRAEEENAYNVKSSIIVLITDGEQAIIHPEDQEDEHKAQSPVDAAALAAEHGIKVYTIGIIPRVIYDDNGTAHDTRRMRGVNFNTGDLEKVAEVTGGKFYRADSGNTLKGIYAEIDKLEKSALPTKKELDVRLEKTKEKKKIETEVTELFPVLLWLGLALLLAEILLEEFYFRRIP